MISNESTHIAMAASLMNQSIDAQHIERAKSRMSAADAQNLALAKKLIAYGKFKDKQRRRARFIRVARVVARGLVVALFFAVFFFALCLEPV